MDIKKHVQQLWLGRVHDLQFEIEVAKTLTAVAEEARRSALEEMRDLVKKQEPMSLADSYSESDDCIDREVLLTQLDSLTK
jgi:hypothetical protein